MFKLRKEGGLKLINIRAKSLASKCMWLKEVLTKDDLSLNKDLIDELIGKQNHFICGTKICFTDQYFIRNANINSAFYKQTLNGFVKLEVRDKMRDCDEESIFMNPIFRNAQGKMLLSTPHFRLNKIFKLKQFKHEKDKQISEERHDRTAVSFLNKLVNTEIEVSDFITIPHKEKLINIELITEKNMYQVFNKKFCTPHRLEVEWSAYLNEEIDFNEVWFSLGNSLITEKTRSVIWEEIHLSFYNTFWFHRVHNLTDICPLCLTPTLSNKHLILDCKITQGLWNDIEPFLRIFTDVPVTKYEMVFGLIEKSIGSKVRNWLSFKLRQCILKQDRVSYEKPGLNNIKQIKNRMNDEMAKEIIYNYYLFKKENKLTKFYDIYNHHVDLFDLNNENKFTIPKIFEV